MLQISIVTSIPTFYSNTMIAKVLLVAFIATTVALVAADPIPVPVPIPANQVRKPVGTCPAKDPATPVYLPDDTNCDIFYECSGGVANEKQCQQGLCFDSKLNVCAWPEVKNVIAPFDAVGTCPPRDTNETVYLRDSANCSIYYVCSNGKPIQNVCPPDMSWNDESHICDWDLDANCQNEKLIIPYNVVGDCPPRDTNETIFLPDSVNCSLYYVCSNGRPIQNVCPPDMSWNNVNHICDWDLDANCNPSGNGNNMIAPLAAVGTCPPRDGNETVFLSDSNNCTIYYICSNGRPIAAACTPGMAWNSKLNICDWEIDVDCTSSKKKIGGKSVVGTCPEHDGSTPTYLPDSEDCQLYYECSNGIPVQNNCPGDQEFNPTLHVCDNPLDAGCKANGGTSAPTEVPTETTTITTEEITTTVSSSLLNILPRSAVGSCPDKDPAVPVFLADDTDCQVYYECSNGVAIKNVCPGELQFNPVLDVCDDPLNAGCKATGTKSPLA